MEINQEILNKVKTLLNEKTLEISTPRQGADSQVFFAKNNNGLEYVIKVGTEVQNDIEALEYIKNRLPGAKIAKIYTSFSVKDKHVLVTDKIKAVQIGSTPKETRVNYLEKIFKELTKIHSLKEHQAGPLPVVIKEKGYTWKEYLKRVFQGKEKYFDWPEIYLRKGVDKKISDKARHYILTNVNKVVPNRTSYSLLHTDINFHNVFVNPATKEIVGIIDWTDATFGDPLFEFARIRMYLWHKYPATALDKYFQLLEPTKEQLIIEEFYFKCFLVISITWFSEPWNPDYDRLKLHYEYLDKTIP